MQLKYAILIDAGFLKKKLGTSQNPINYREVLDFIEKMEKFLKLKDARLYRIYYYDAEPYANKKFKPLTGGKFDGKWQAESFDFSATPTHQSNIKILDELKRQPYFAVRLGDASFRGWLVKRQKLDPQNTTKKIQVTASDLIPNIQQKGVDMRIGLDVASLSLKNHVDLIVLVTGDSDLIPALKFARQEGKQVILCTLGQRIRPEMYAHADVCIEVSIEDMEK